MVTFNTEALCKEAEAHYFDFLAEGDSDVVPRHIIDHIRGCRHCRSKIEQLDTIFAHTCSSSAASKTNAAIVTMLKFHFAYLGRMVTCKTVKPFLPTLIDSTLEIRIPTPITVHLDHCHSCSEDLERIRELNLSRGQLCRLSRMYADRSKDKYIACPKAHAVINSVVNLSLHETNADTLKHLCLCSFCRELVVEARKFAIKLLPESTKSGEGSFCGQVSPGDIFDYAVPYGLDPSNDQYVKFRESLTAHMRKCPTCLGRIQELHQTLFGIIDRPESGVVTICHTIESTEAKTPAAKHPEDLYSGFPIQVEVIGTQSVAVKKQPMSPTIAASTISRRFSIKRLAPLAKFGGIAAAVAIIAILFLFTTPSAKAVTLEQIYKAVLEVKNVYIASFTPGKTEPTQEKWVSRSLNIYITSAGGELALWDPHRGIRKTRASETDETKQTTISNEDTARIKTMIGGSLGLLPFEDISVLPKDAQWHRLADANMPRNISRVEVYDLLWAEKAYSGLSTFNRWRVFIDPETNLPRKTEIYQMLPGEQDYVLKSFNVIEYQEDNEMLAMLGKLPF